MNSKKKELKKEYQQTHTPMGIYQVSNLANGKVLIGTSLNLPAMLNRQKFQLQLGGHPNKVLQNEWREFGGEKFAFGVLDEIAPRADPAYDYREDLTALEDLWLDKLQPYDEHGYNERKKGTEEKLRRIAENRLQRDRERD